MDRKVIENALKKFKLLSRRERLAVYGAACFICVVIVVKLIIFPIIDGKAQLKRELAAKKNALAEMTVLKNEYDAVSQAAEMSDRLVSGREKGFTLFSFLDRLAGETGVKDKITYMKPSTTEKKDSQYGVSQVEMKLQGLTMKQLTNYLYRVETSGNMVVVKRITISMEGKKEGYIDAVLHLETINV